MPDLLVLYDYQITDAGVIAQPAHRVRKTRQLLGICINLQVLVKLGLLTICVLVIQKLDLQILFD